MNLIKFYKKKKQPLIKNVNSRILDAIEKEKGNVITFNFMKENKNNFFKLKNFKLICSTEIDLVISYNPYFYNWIRYADGTLCLIKDINRKMFIFRLYNSIVRK